MEFKLTDFQILDKSAEILKVLAHPIRLAIVELLLEKGKLSVSDIFEIINIEQSVASYHLKNLRMVNIVISKRAGTKIFYEIAHDEVGQIFSSVKDFSQS